MSANVYLSPYKGASASKGPACTIRRHSKVDLNKSDMLQLLSYLEGELQARDVVVAILQSEKIKGRLRRAERDGQNKSDPLLALQRDSDIMNDYNFGEAEVRAMYDEQLWKLENLIESQQKGEKKMKTMVASIENECLMTNARTAEEEARHEKDVRFDESILQLLKKDKEKLTEELVCEERCSQELEEELRQLQMRNDEADDGVDYELLAVQLIKEQSALMQKVARLKGYSEELDGEIEREEEKVRELERGVSREEERLMQEEAVQEKKLSEIDFQRQQLHAKLNKAQQQQQLLISQLQQLQQQQQSTEALEQQNNEILQKQQQKSPKTFQQTPILQHQNFHTLKSQIIQNQQHQNSQQQHQQHHQQQQLQHQPQQLQQRISASNFSPSFTETKSTCKTSGMPIPITIHAISVNNKRFNTPQAVNTMANKLSGRSPQLTNVARFQPPPSSQQQLVKQSIQQLKQSSQQQPKQQQLQLKQPQQQTRMPQQIKQQKVSNTKQIQSTNNTINQQKQTKLQSSPSSVSSSSSPSRPPPPIRKVPRIPPPLPPSKPNLASNSLADNAVAASNAKINISK